MIQLLSGIQIDGDTAKKYCAKTKEQKVEFIVKFCKVDNTTAKAFVDKPLVHSDGKQCCGGHKHVNNGNNISTTIQQEVANVDSVGEGGSKSNGTNSEGRKQLVTKGKRK